MTSFLAFMDRLGEAIVRFFATGLFFMLFGTCFLWFANESLQRTHAAFTFVIVVLGAAMVLYGTGTQALGEMDKVEDKNAFKIKIAGGAGVMSLVIAFGALTFSEKMRDVFSVQRKFVIVPVELKNTAGSGTPIKLSEYAIILSNVNGEPVPAVHRQTHIDVYVPFFDADAKKSVRLQIALRHQNNPPRLNTMAQEKEFLDPIELVPLDRTGGIEWPKNNKPVYVDLTADQISQPVIVPGPDPRGPDTSFQPK